jgi:hypothetical protein
LSRNPHFAATLLGQVLGDQKQAAGVVVGQRMKQNGVDDAEDGRVSSDAKRKRQHAGKGEG